MTIANLFYPSPKIDIGSNGSNLHLECIFVCGNADADCSVYVSALTD